MEKWMGSVDYTIQYDGLAEHGRVGHSRLPGWRRMQAKRQEEGDHSAATLNEIEIFMAVETIHKRDSSKREKIYHASGRGMISRRFSPPAAEMLENTVLL